MSVDTQVAAGTTTEAGSDPVGAVEGVILELGARDLADALHNIAPHADAKDVLPVLQHLALTPTPSGLVVAGTDRYTFAEQTVPYVRSPQEGQLGARRALLHVGQVRSLVKVLTEWAHGRPETSVLLDAARLTLTTVDQWPLVGDQSLTFPRYEDLWPTTAGEGHVTFGLSARQVAKYTRLRLHGKGGHTLDNLRLDAGRTRSKPLLVTSVELTAAGVAFRSLLMPVSLTSN